jgi:hypothetical protein
MMVPWGALFWGLLAAFSFGVALGITIGERNARITSQR